MRKANYILENIETAIKLFVTIMSCFFERLVRQTISE